jgi:WD40 repeat protein
MSDTGRDASIYTVGGAVQAANGLYLPRAADDELHELCSRGDFAYVLTPRQLGKSSLMVRTAERLSEEGVRLAIIDLSAFGVDTTSEAWYLGLLVKISDQLMLDADVVGWWKARAHESVARRLTAFFKEVLLREVTERVVIFFDEIDTTLSLSFTDDFYAAIRYFYNARAQRPEFKRLSFVLIGVATPGDLIRDPQRTPFNIGQRVDLTDFTFDEALPLAAGLGLTGDESRRVLGWVLEWTAGHPYLTQRLCRAVADEKREGWTKGEIARVVSETFLGEMSEKDNNLQFVRDMLTKRAPDLAGVLATYRETLHRPVRDEEQSIIKSHLKLSGVVRREDGRLRVRNPIYYEVFDERWVRGHLPVNWLRLLTRIAAGILIVLMVLSIPLAVYAWKQKSNAEMALNNERALREKLEETNTKLQETNSKLIQSVELERKARGNAEESATAAETARAQATQAKDEAEEQRQVAEQQEKEAEASRADALKQKQEADRLRTIALSGLLGAQSQVLAKEQPGLIQRSVQLARDSVLQSPNTPSIAGYQILSDELTLLPRMMAGVNDQDDKDYVKAFITTRSAFVAGKIVTWEYNDDQHTQLGTLTLWEDLWRKKPERELSLLEQHGVNDTLRYACVEKKDLCVVTDIFTGKELAQLPGYTIDHRGSFIFDVSPSGRYIASVTVGAESVLIKDVEKQKDFPIPQLQNVSSLRFSPTGRYLVIGESNVSVSSVDGGQTFDVWDVDNNAWIQGPMQFSLVVFSPNEKSVVYSPADKRQIYIINLDGSRGGEWGVDALPSIVKFSPDSKYVFAVSSNGAVTIRDVQGIEKGSVNHGESVSDIVFDGDGKYFATVGGHTVRVWSLMTHEEVARVVEDEALSAAFSPDGDLLTSGRGTTHLWKMPGSEDGPRRTLYPDVSDYGWSLDHRYLAFVYKSAAKLAVLHVWDTKLTREISPLSGIDLGEMYAFEVSPDGMYAAAWQGEVVRVFEVPTGNAITVVKVDGEQGAYITLSKGAKYLAFGGPTRGVKVWDTKTSKQVYSSDSSFDFALSPDGEYLVATGSDGDIQLLHLPDGKDSITISRKSEGAKSFTEGEAIANISPNGDYFVVRNWVWARNRTTGQFTKLFRSESFNGSMAFSADGRFLSGVDPKDFRVVRVWEVGTGNEIALRHDSVVPRVPIFSGDDRYLLTESGGSSHVWRLSDRRELARLAPGSTPMAFGMDSKFLIIMKRLMDNSLGPGPDTAEVRLWQSEDLIKQTCDRLTLPEPTSDEWRNYLGEELVKYTRPPDVCSSIR